MQMNSTAGLNPRIATQITFQNAQQQIVASPIPVSPQYIELRHNSQRLPIGTQLVQRGPQPRPRLPLPNQEIGSFVHQMQGCKVISRGASTPLPQSPVGIALLPQQNISAPLPSSPHSVEVSSAHQHIQTKDPLATTGQGEAQQTFQSSSSTTTSTSSCSTDALKDNTVPFPLNSVSSISSVVRQHTELDPRKISCDDSVVKALDEELDSPKELDEEDDLANLSLDPDSKTDDELGNLDNLETNDPHLDDLLKCEEFDLLAYTDPELDTGDKKDIFTEQLRLVESANEKAEENQDILADQDAVGPAGECTTDNISRSDTEKTTKEEENEKAKAKSDIADTLSTSDRITCESVNNVNSETITNSQCSDPATRAPSTDNSPKPTLGLVLKVEENVSQNSACQFVANTSAAQTVLIKAESPPKGDDERGAVSMLLNLGTGLNVNTSVALCQSSTCTTSGTQTSTQSGTVVSGSHGTPRMPNNEHSNVDLESVPCTSSTQIISKLPLVVQSRPSLTKFGLDEMCQHVPSMEPKRRSVDDLVKVESSLEASELPLLLHDLLEQEKMELQQQQQQQQLGGSQCISAQQQQQHSGPKAHLPVLHQQQQLEVSHQPTHPGLSQHLPTTQQSQHLEGPPQNLNLPQPHILGVIQHHQLGIPRSLASSQQQQLTASQQRLGASPHVAMSQQQQQQHVATGQHPTQQIVASQQSQHLTSPQLLPTQQLAVSQIGIMQQTQQVVMQQQQLANAFFPDTGTVGNEQVTNNVGFFLVVC